MRTLLSLLLTSVALLTSEVSQAQHPPAPDSAAVPAVSRAATDVIVRTNGEELPGRVVRITPQLVRYLPVGPDSLGQAAAAAPDTLQLAAAEVFMVRYANGTQEVLRSAPASGPNSGNSLLGLSAAQRQERGRQDSRRYYKPSKGVFWGTLASTVTTGYGGLVASTVISLTNPPRAKLNAPEPALLQDPAYFKGYNRQAKNRKLGKAATGFGLGAAIVVTVTGFLVIRYFGVR